MPVICVWKIISIISLPTYKEPKKKKNHILHKALNDDILYSLHSLWNMWNLM